MDAGLGRRAPLRAPFTVCLWLTDFCNLDCSYCYAKPFSGRRMDPDRVLRLVDELGALGVFDLTLAGGEPTLHPEWLEIVRRSVEGGARVGLLTNGVTLTDDAIARLEAVTTKQNFILQVSIDSPDPATNDAVRGKTHKVLASLDRLSKSKLEVQVACVVHKRNAPTAHRIIDRFYPGIKRFHFLNVQRTAPALANPDLLMNEEETLAFWLGLNEHTKNFPEDLFLPSLRIQMRTLGRASTDPQASLHKQASWESKSCSAGWTHVNVTSDFDVLGCDIAKDHTWMGNCRDRTFHDVWHSEEADRVRNAPYPACYKIAGPDGAKLEDHVKPQFVPVSRLLRNM